MDLRGNQSIQSETGNHPYYAERVNRNFKFLSSTIPPKLRYCLGDQTLRTALHQGCANNRCHKYLYYTLDMLVYDSSEYEDEVQNVSVAPHDLITQKTLGLRYADFFGLTLLASPYFWKNR